MYKYLFFIVFGILIYLLYNRKETLNIGEECETDINCNQDDGKECIGQCKCVDDGSGTETSRCLALAGGGAGTMAGGNKLKILMDSYKICNPSIYDDILSVMRCMMDSNEISHLHCTKEGECHRGRAGVISFVIENHKFYNGKPHRLIPALNEYKWSELNELLRSNDHYIVKCNIMVGHFYFLEFKDSKFRILSLWATEHGYLDFPFNNDGGPHRWAYFDGHENFDTFLGLLKTINGNIELDDFSLDNYFKYELTQDEMDNAIRTIRDIFNFPNFTTTNKKTKGMMNSPEVYKIEMAKNIEQLMTDAGLRDIYVNIKYYLEEIGIDKNSTKEDLIELYEEQEQATEGDETILQSILDLIEDEGDKRKFLNFIKEIYEGQLNPSVECAATD